MSFKLFECVANFSEGRDSKTIQKCRDAVAQVKDCHVLHLDSGIDANRTVITFAGSGAGVLAGAKALCDIVSQSIDMTSYQGEHPCVGALDVVPFVPLFDSSLEEAKALASAFGEYASEKHGIPVYLYRDSQELDHRRHLSQIRKGGFLGLASRFESDEKSWRPDFFPSGVKLTRRLGATVCGARGILIAFNLELGLLDLKLAKDIAKKVRKEFKSIRAIGWNMPEFSCSQVSTNIEDFREDGLFELFNFVERHSSVISTELIGLVPQGALVSKPSITNEGFRLEDAKVLEEAARCLKIRDFSVGNSVLEPKLRASGLI